MKKIILATLFINALSFNLSAISDKQINTLANTLIKCVSELNQFKNSTHVHGDVLSQVQHDAAVRSFDETKGRIAALSKEDKRKFDTSLRRKYNLSYLRCRDKTMIFQERKNYLHELCSLVGFDPRSITPEQCNSQKKSALGIVVDYIRKAGLDVDELVKRFIDIDTKDLNAKIVSMNDAQLQQYETKVAEEECLELVSYDGVISIKKGYNKYELLSPLLGRLKLANYVLGEQGDVAPSNDDDDEGSLPHQAPENGSSNSKQTASASAGTHNHKYFYLSRERLRVNREAEIVKKAMRSRLHALLRQHDGLLAFKFYQLKRKIERLVIQINVQEDRLKYTSDRKTKLHYPVNLRQARNLVQELKQKHSELQREALPRVREALPRVREALPRQREVYRELMYR